MRMFTMPWLSQSRLRCSDKAVQVIEARMLRRSNIDAYKIAYLRAAELTALRMNFVKSRATASNQIKSSLARLLVVWCSLAENRSRTRTYRFSGLWECVNCRLGRLDRWWDEKPAWSSGLCWRFYLPERLSSPWLKVRSDSLAKYYTCLRIFCRVFCMQSYHILLTRFVFLFPPLSQVLMTAYWTSRNSLSPASTVMSMKSRS